MRALSRRGYVNLGFARFLTASRPGRSPAWQSGWHSGLPNSIASSSCLRMSAGRPSQNFLLVMTAAQVAVLSQGQVFCTSCIFWV